MSGFIISNRDNRIPEGPPRWGSAAPGGTGNKNVCTGLAFGVYTCGR